MDVNRRAVLDYRVDALGLHRDAGALSELAVFDLGVQETYHNVARLALSARLSEPPPIDPTADCSLTLAWTLRGAPYLHRTADLPALASALWPTTDADALAQLSWPRGHLADSGIGGIDAWRIAAEVVREVVTAPMTKGAVSSAVTKLVPPQLNKWCKPCNTTHINESLLRFVAVPAGTRLEFDRSPATLAPLNDPPSIPTAAAGRTGLIEAYLRLLGPAGPAEVAGYLGVRQTEVKASWPPDGLAEVRVEGRPAWLPADRLAALQNPRPADIVRLLPSFDPFLQARDRHVLLPDKNTHRTLWTVLGNPGAVLADGEITGVWRAKASGRRLALTITPFEVIPPQVRRAIDVEAQRIAAVRDATDLHVEFIG